MDFLGGSMESLLNLHGFLGISHVGPWISHWCLEFSHGFLGSSVISYEFHGISQGVHMNLHGPL